ncbi:Rieske 2Fe-2S domain-containing protein [Undibacterium arcticum]|uniref:Rieske 2Fe-2S domain-containing protein n=1 Tax=Undibacterium arcticum TaxID=1762892 RepID=UPI00360D58E8
MPKEPPVAVVRLENRPYGGYHNPHRADDDGFITSVGRGTPGGDYLRHYWHPFLLVSELKDLPIPVRLLGEDLVVFRDGSGRYGLLHRQCIHRGASLEYGIVAERGIRCSYHGWHFDVDGKVLDTPGEPPSSTIKEKFFQGAYKVREWQGLLFAYMGPAEDEPEFPIYDSTGYPIDNKVVPYRMNLPCNWVQIVENGCDPIHNAFLHAIVAGQQFSPVFKVLPQLDFPKTALGFLSMATRKVGDYVFIRAGEIGLPNFGQFPNGSNMANRESAAFRPWVTRWAVAVDDHNSFYIGFANVNSYNDPGGVIKPEEFGVDQFNFIGQTGDRPYAERQREPGDYDALVSQGAVANRKVEHLGTTDRGVVLFRRMLANAIREVQDGQSPLYQNFTGVARYPRTHMNWW